MFARVLRRLVLLGALVVALAAAPAAAAPVVDGEFDVPGLDTNNKLAAGPDGNVWVTLGGVVEDVARITPAGEVTPYDLGVNNPLGIAAGPDGRLWVTYNTGVVSFEPGDPVGTKDPTTIAAVTGTHSIVTGPDGNLWVAADDNLIKVPPGDPGNPVVTPVAGLGPRGIDVAGALLAIADFGNSRILTATTDVAPVLSGYPTTDAPQGVAGAASGLVAFSAPNNNLGLLTPPGPPVPIAVPGTDPFGVALGPDGAFWSALFVTDSVARLTPEGQLTTLGGFAAGSGPRQIAAGPGNTLWVTLETTNKVGRVSGVNPPDPPLNLGPIAGPRRVTPDTRIVKGPKGKVWTKRMRAKVAFRFRAIPARGARFQCSLVKLTKRKKGKAAPRPRFKSCGSPKLYRLKPGRYRFQVRAVLRGVPDPTPAKRTFRVVRAR